MKKIDRRQRKKEEVEKEINDINSWRSKEVEEKRREEDKEKQCE